MAKNPAVPATRKPVTLEFRGKTYDVSFSFNDFVEIETLSKTNFLEGITSNGTPSLALVRAGLFLVLRKGGTSYATPEDLGLDMDLASVAPMWNKLLTGIYESRAQKQDPPQAAAS